MKRTIEMWSCDYQDCSDCKPAPEAWDWLALKLETRSRVLMEKHFCVLHSNMLFEKLSLVPMKEEAEE